MLSFSSFVKASAFLSDSSIFALEAPKSSLVLSAAFSSSSSVRDALSLCFDEVRLSEYALEAAPVFTAAETGTEVILPAVDKLINTSATHAANFFEKLDIYFSSLQPYSSVINFILQS